MPAALPSCWEYCTTIENYYQLIFFTNLILDEGAPGFGDAKRQGRIGRRRADEVKRYRLPPPQIVRTIRGCPCTNDSSLKNRSYNGGFRAKWLRACVVRTIGRLRFVRTTQGSIARTIFALISVRTTRGRPCTNDFRRPEQGPKRQKHEGNRLGGLRFPSCF